MSPRTSVQTKMREMNGKSKDMTTAPAFQVKQLMLYRYQFNQLPSPPPRLTAGPLILSIKIPTSGTAFSAKLQPPGKKNETKIPTPGHNSPSSNAKISLKRERYSIKQFLSKFSIIHLTIFFYRENKSLASLYTTVKINTV